MPLAVEQFVRDLVENGVLSAAEVQAAQQSITTSNGATVTQDLARELVKRGKLTPLQANAAYAGRTKNLVLGQYLVLDKIAAGGMGQVFKAAHKLMRRTVAIKVLPRAALSSPEAVERFQREVQAVARLEHPNVVMAFDADEAAGLHFLVMQYFDGEDLAALVKHKGALSVNMAIDYTLQAARGLAYAHQHGVIHRDVKPANLLVDHEGTVKILDLGLARITAGEADANLTCAGQVLGTVDYMSPEQGADIHQADGRADIYSLGCTLFTLLSGRPMFGGNTPIDKLLAHRTQPPPTLSSVRPDVPEPLNRIYLKMVAKRPEDRYQTMPEVVGELTRLRGTAVVPPPVLNLGNQATHAWIPTATPISLPGMDPAAGQRGALSQAPTALAGAATTAVAAPKSDHFLIKLGGTVFATILAPILVAVALKYSDAIFPGPAPAADPASAAGPMVGGAQPAVPAASPRVPQTAVATPAAAAISPPAAPVAVATPAALAATSSPSPPAKTPPPPLRLFNGFGLSGFTLVLGPPAKGKPPLGNHDPEHVFHVARGHLHISGKVKGMLITQQDYRNYRLTIEYKWGQKIWSDEDDPFRDSGLLLHCQGIKPVVRELWPVALRCEIGEGHTGDLFLLSLAENRFSLEAEGEKRMVQTRGGKRSNFFYKPGAPLSIFSAGSVRALGCQMAGDVRPGERQRQQYELPLGQWNTLECLCQQNTLTVSLNRTKINHVVQLSHTKGRIALQSTNAEIVIRSMMLQPLD